MSIVLCKDKKKKKKTFLILQIFSSQLTVLFLSFEFCNWVVWLVLFYFPFKNKYALNQTYALQAGFEARL